MPVQACFGPLMGTRGQTYVAKLSSETVGGATYQNPLTTTKKHDLRLKTTARKS